MRALIASLALLLTTACAGPVVIRVPEPTAPVAERSTPAPRRDAGNSAKNFVQVVDDVMPLARDLCRSRTQGVRCDYAVLVDDRAGQEPNAFQTLSPEGQPVIGFTLSLILLARNIDELAFMLSHEAAHHIEGHIARGRESAAVGAEVAGRLAALTGGDQVAIERARNFGAFYGARRYAKSFELEADALGAIIAQRAGYDPVRGVMFFQDAPDPGTQFLGTHPPNADRIDIVRRTVGR